MKKSLVSLLVVIGLHMSAFAHDGIPTASMNFDCKIINHKGESVHQQSGKMAIDESQVHGNYSCIMSKDYQIVCLQFRRWLNINNITFSSFYFKHMNAQNEIKRTISRSNGRWAEGAVFEHKIKPKFPNLSKGNLSCVFTNVTYI